MDNLKLIDSSSIVYKTVLISLSFGSMGNSRSVSKDVLNTDANKDYLRVNKKLLESPELELITKRDAQIRQYVHSLCFKYEDGLMMLPREYMVEVNERLKSYEAERNQLVIAFLTVYPVLCQQSADALGSLWNPNQYPDVNEVAERFRFNWTFRDFAVPEALKMVGLYDQEQEKVSAKLALVADEITLLMRQQVLDLVSHLKDSLEPGEDGKTKRFHTSSITNIQDFIDAFKAKNVTNDTELESVLGTLGSLVSGYNLEKKKDEDFKQTVHDDMAMIATQLGELVEKVPGRKFKTLEF